MLFWHDTWCCPTPLAIAFPDIFALANQKNGQVADHIVRDNNPLAWDLYLRRSVRELFSLSSTTIRLERVEVGRSTRKTSNFGNLVLPISSQ